MEASRHHEDQNEYPLKPPEHHDDLVPRGVRGSQQTPHYAERRELLGQPEQSSTVQIEQIDF